MHPDREAICSEAVRAGVRAEDLMFRFWYECSSLRAGTGLFPVITVSEENLPAVFRLAESLQLPLFPLGGGTNLAGCDRDFTAIGLKIADKSITIRESCVSAGAGSMLGVLASRLPESGLGGLAPLSGIPGTVGGALRMNAGANGICISEFLLDAEGVDLDTKQPFSVSGRDSGWSYRRSPLPESALVFSARFSFPETEPETEKQAILAERSRRKNVTPSGGSAGSVFKNPSPDQPAGRLIESCGCKGMSKGAFQVSEKHANWIVNPGFQPGRAEDCIGLMELVREKVFRQCGVLLQPEWRLAPGNDFQQREVL